MSVQRRMTPPKRGLIAQALARAMRLGPRRRHDPSVRVGGAAARLHGPTLTSSTAWGKGVLGTPDLRFGDI